MAAEAVTRSTFFPRPSVQVNFGHVQHNKQFTAARVFSTATWKLASLQALPLKQQSSRQPAVL